MRRDQVISILKSLKPNLNCTVMYQTDPPRPPKEVLPTMYDLPSEEVEDPGLPDEFHIFQPQLLRETFIPPIYPLLPILLFAKVQLNLLRIYLPASL